MAVYEEMKQRSDINEYSKWSNDVERGKPAVLVERGSSLVERRNLGDGIYQVGNGESGTEGRENFEGIEREEKSRTGTETTITHIAPLIKQTSSDDGVFFDGELKTKERSFVKTATESDVVGGQVITEDLSEEVRTYFPVSNEKTLDTARKNLINDGYEKAVNKAVSLIESKGEVSLIDIAECEIQNMHLESLILLRCILY